MDLQGSGDVDEVMGLLVVALCCPLSTASCSTHSHGKA